ncbi:MAG TPA: hypothetical protein VGW38_13395 [Chloroflexota bacterium]|nr:hypothetical protein [Chloroflexota bacterium]
MSERDVEVRLWTGLADRLPETWRVPVITVHPAGPTTRPSARVWKIALEDGRSLALKVAAPDAPVDREAKVLSYLREHNCPVPEVVAIAGDEPASWLALEWCGDSTLDDALQGALTADGRRLATDNRGLQLADAVACVERACAGLGQPSAAQIEALNRQATPWFEAAREGLSWLQERERSARDAHTFEEVVATARSQVASAGSLDYNACNVVTQEHRMFLLDFATFGYDWPARRFVQYGTATGAGLKRGTFASALSPEATDRFASHLSSTYGLDVQGFRWAIDAHEVLLLLIAAAQLSLVQAGRAHEVRSETWNNIEQRRSSLLALLRRPLIDDGPAARLRTLSF